MKQLLIVKPGSISSKDKEKLTKAGYLLIEHPFPGDVRIVTQIDGLNGDVLMQALVAGASYDSYSRGLFGTTLLKFLKKEEIKTEPKP